MNSDVQIENHPTLNNGEIYQNTPIFQTNEEMKQSLKHFCYGDFYILGRLWIETMRKVLIGANMDLLPNIIPVVQSADKEDEKGKKEAEKYQAIAVKDLPVYDDAYSDYKDESTEVKDCDVNKLIIHEPLLPYISDLRVQFMGHVNRFKQNTIDGLYAGKDYYFYYLKEFHQYVRSPERLRYRQATVVTAGMTGYLIACKNHRGPFRRCLYTTLGLLWAGILCFPKETDQICRDLAYNTGQVLMVMYRYGCNQEGDTKDQPKCKRDLAKQKVIQDQCKVNKKGELERLK